MFKRFLKFFRGEEAAPAESFEGSYLDHLLTRVEPLVKEQLEDCPDHDPLLLVVVGILRQTMMGAWSPLLRTPLHDSQSPGQRPSLRPDDVIATNEFPAAVVGDADQDLETVDDGLTLADVMGEDEAGKLVAAAKGEDEAEADEAEATADEALDDTIDPPPMPRGTRKTEEIDAEEVRLASLQATLVETAELDRVERDPPEADPTVEIDQERVFAAQQQADGRPRIDSEEVLQAGRVFLGLLIENDRLPMELQLSVAETTLARDLLLGYFVGNDDFEEKARKLLTLVEQKFGEGMFSQARILLQLFHTDEQTRVNNDRNLFYEDMILRLGIRRRHRMGSEELQRFKTLVDEVRSPQGASAVISWMASACMINLHSFNRDDEQVSTWNALLEHAALDEAVDTFLRYLPARRWRQAAQADESTAVASVIDHVNLDTARDYVISQIKTCYFVLRAVGDTGLEGFLDTFFDWSTDTFGLDGTRLMPELYKRSMMDPEPMDSILRDIYETYYAERTAELVGELNDDGITEALYDALTKIGDCDLAEIAPGYYDVGAFVFDELFGVTYPTSEFPFKVHRLT